MENVSRKKCQEVLPNDCILATLRGSLSTGTSREGISDVDILSTHIGPVEHYLGFRRKGCETIDRFEGKYDVVSHEIRKLFDLLLGGNPNVVSMLFVPQNMVVYRNALGNIIRKNKDVFISKNFYMSFKGYSHSMKKRLEKQKFQGHEAGKREEETKKLGYNPKAASEMIRIVDSGIQLLRDGEIQYPHPKAERLKEIKNGEVDLDVLLRAHENKIAYLKYLYDHSDIPQRPDRERAEELLMTIVKMRHNL